MSRRAPESRREAVIEAARELFIQHGQSGTSVDAIATRAGVAKGTVYLYFSSKEHIVEAIEAQFNARILDRVHSAARNVAAAGTDAITAWCVELAHAYLDQLDTHDMLFFGRAASRETDDPLLDDLAGLLTANERLTPTSTAAFLLGGTTLVIDRAIATGDPQREQITQTLTPLVHAVINGRAVIS